jgi:predicted  nucleic acid-binding Zn-ribbon protein
LILIALIDLFFSGRGVGDLNRDLRDLRSEIGRLKEAVESQTNQIKALQEKLDELKQESSEAK